MSLVSIVALLQAALMLLSLVQSHPELPQSVRDNAVRVAQNAITTATTEMGSRAEDSGSSTGQDIVPVVTPCTACIIPIPQISPKLVGMEYEVWFPSIPNGTNFWQPRWGTPLLGTYASNDPVVIDKHAEWLSATGVDFILVDWSENLTNSAAGNTIVEATIKSRTDAVFAEYARLSQQGKAHPKIAILLGAQDATIDGKTVTAQNIVNSGALQQEADYIYNNYTIRYPDIYFSFHGKPLVLTYLGTPISSSQVKPTWNDERFTVRWLGGFLESQPNVYNGNTTNNIFWSWIDRDPVPAYHNGKVESVTVTQAYLGAGGSWLDTTSAYPARGRGGAGEQTTFAKQWSKAIAYNPEVILLNQWNEFTSQDRNGLASGDEYSTEFSNDVEPTTELGCGPLKNIQTAISRWKSIPLPSINCTASAQTAPSSPIGIFDKIDTNGTLDGWAYDPDAQLRSLTMRVYMDGTVGTGQLMVTFTADDPSPDVVQAEHLAGGNHRFHWQIPSQYQNASHQWYVYAVDDSGATGDTFLGSKSFIGGKGAFISDVYRCVLGREPEATGLAGWVAAPSDTTLGFIFTTFFRSSEYVSRATSNSTYVGQLYQCILGRTGEATGVSGWVGGLSTGMSRDYVLNTFLNSTEFKTIHGPALQTQTGWMP